MFELTFVAQLINATAGIDTEEIIDNLHIRGLIDDGCDPIVAFECRYLWIICTDSMDWELYRATTSMDLGELFEFADAIGAKYQ